MFEGPQWENLRTENELENAISTMAFPTGASASKPLETRSLSRLERNATTKTLAPTVVVVITDGDVSYRALPPLLQFLAAFPTTRC
jgi:hypothetical protein